MWFLLGSCDFGEALSDGSCMCLASKYVFVNEVVEHFL